MPRRAELSYREKLAQTNREAKATVAALVAIVAGGTLAYCVIMALGFKVADLHQIVIGIVVAGVCMVAGSLASAHAPSSRMDVFFPEE